MHACCAGSCKISTQKALKTVIVSNTMIFPYIPLVLFLFKLMRLFENNSLLGPDWIVDHFYAVKVGLVLVIIQILFLTTIS